MLLSGTSALDVTPLSSSTTSLVATPFPASMNPDVASPTYVTLDYSGTTTPATGSSPVGNGLNPTQILNAYGISQITFAGGTVQGNGAGETIAIVDAYNDPDITEDLATFDAAFGIAAPPSFQVVSQTGSTTSLPSNDTTGWAVEESLDVEWSHAIAPDANIILVEANSNSFTDLNTAVGYATSVPGVVAVSMSYSGSEFSTETSYDSLYTTPAGHTGITFLAATGDYGEPSGYPAYSPNVVAVGGTTLSTDAAGDYLGESGWGSGAAGLEGSGGGLSEYESQPSWQNGVVTQSSTQRAAPDVSFDADPNSGPAIIDSYTYGSTDPWLQIGGTSFATPAWAGLIAIADQGRAENGLSSLAGGTQTLPLLYSLQNSGGYHDITTGNNGYAAGPGYDLVTGIGTPVANLLITDLAYNLAVASTTPAVGSIVATPPTSFVVQFDSDYSASSVAASDFTVNGIAASSYTLSSATSITFNFSSSPVTSIGQQTESLSGILDAAEDTPMAPFSGNFRYDPHPIQVSSTTPGEGDVATLPLTTFDVTFSEPYAASSISTSNLSLSVGTVTGFTLVPATNTVDYTISGVTQEGVTGLLTVSMAYGAVTDVEGDPMQQAFTSTYILDVTTAPFPTPLAMTAGLGSLVYQQSVVGTIGFVGDTDSYTLNLNAGETLTVVGTAGATLQPSLMLQGPGGSTVAADSAPAAGQAALVQTYAVTATGQYTMVIAGLAGDTGQYTLQAYVNAAVQDEQYGGPANQSQSSAQNLSAGFISLGVGASQGAVIGTLTGATDQDWYSFQLNAGDTITLNGEYLGGSGTMSIVLWNSSATALATSAPAANYYQQTIGDFVAPTTGTYYAQVTASAGFQYSLVLTRNADIANQENNTLSTAQPLAGAQVGGQQVVVGNVSDPVIESFDNSNSLSAYTVTNPSLSYATLSAAAAHDGPLGLSLGNYTPWIYRTDPAAQLEQGETFSVWAEPTSLSSYFEFGFGATSAGTLMVLLEPTELALGVFPTYTSGSQLAETSQNLAANQWYLVQVVWGTGGAMTANLYASDGKTLLGSVSATDNAFTAGGIAFRGVDFNTDTVTNDVATTATYTFTAAGGSTLVASTTTPGDGAAGINTFDPELLLYNSTGALVASNDNSGPDGRNALLAYNVPAGSSGVYFLQVIASPLTPEPTTGDYVLSVVGDEPDNAPVLSTTGTLSLVSISEDPAGDFGTLVSSILATGATISDPNPGAAQGIAVTSVDNTNGTWQYSTNNGSTWYQVGSPSPTNALLLAASARLRFTPATNYSGTASFSFQAWDQTAGLTGSTMNLVSSGTGGYSPISLASGMGSITVTEVYHAPILLGGAALTAQTENNNNSQGTLISTLAAGIISDPDPGELSGIAIVGASTADGSWQYSTAGASGPWLPLGSVSTSAALLLAADGVSRIRFVPNAGYYGTQAAALTIRAWNQMNGLASGSVVNATVNGGTTALSSTTAAVSLSILPPADTSDWSGAGGNSNWSNGANWVGGVAPSAGDTLVFPASAVSFTSNNDFAAGTQFASVTILGSGYTVTGDTVDLLDGFVAGNTSGSNSFTAPVTLAAPQTIDNANSGGSLTLGAINTGTLLVLTFDGAGTTNVGGVLSGSGTLVKNGTGTLVLSGSNTYTGLTLVDQGVLSAQNSNALGAATAGTTVASGAALQVQGGVTIAEPLSINGDGVGVGTSGALLSTGGNNNLTGPIDLASATMIGASAGSVLDISGIVSSLGYGLTKVGSGELELSGTTSNDITGATTALQGTLLLNMAAGALAVEGNVVVGDNLQGSNASVLELGASGQIPSVDPTGETLLNVTVYSSGLLNFNGFSDTIGSLSMDTGQTYSANVETGAGMLTLGGNLTVIAAGGSSGASPAATISGNLNLGSLGSFSGGTSAMTTRTFTINDTDRSSLASDLTISANISGPAGTSLTRSGSGTLTLTGNNTYAGTTLLTDGLTEIGSSTALGSGTVVINAAQLDAVGGAQTIANPIEIDGAATFWGTNRLTFSGPTTMSANRSFYVLDPSETVTFSGGIGEGAASGSTLFKWGPGTLSLTGTNTYSGSTVIEQGGGTIDLGSGGTLLDTSNITVDDQGTFQLDNSLAYVAARISPLATISLAGGTLDFVGAAGTATSESIGAVTLAAGHTSTIESDQAAGGTAVLTLASLATASGATVSFVGTGSPLSATGANQIDITLSPGSLTNGIMPYATVSGPSTLDFATYVSNSAGVAVTALPAADYVTSLANAGPTSNVLLSSPGTYASNGASVNALLIEGTGITVGGANDSLTVSSGQVVFAGGGTNTLSVGRLNLGSQDFITTDSGSTATISGVVTGGSSSLTKAGSGTLVLSGANRFYGSESINQGVLEIENSAALGAPTTSVTVNQGATLALADPGGSPVNVGQTALTLWGTGFDNMGALVNLAGNSNSWAGAISLNEVWLDSTTVISNYGGAPMGATFINSSSGQLSLTGVISGTSALVTAGAGTVALGGVSANTFSGNTIVEQGTLLLDKAPGVIALGTSALDVIVGTDQASASPGQLVLGANNQISSAASIVVDADGSVNFNNFSNAISSLTLTIGPSGSGSFATGTGTLTLGSGGIDAKTIGAGNPSAATLSGNLALSPFTTTPGSSLSDGITVNNGAVGDDLIISAAISDGSGLSSVGISKFGAGTLQFAGPAANTYTGTTEVYDGTLELNKTAGVDAFMGPLVVGDGVVVGSGSLVGGGADSDVVRLLNNNQIPAAMAPITINSTGLLDLNGFSNTVGNLQGQAAITMNAGSITTGAGTLTLDGDLTIDNISGAVIGVATISGNLNLGSVSRTFAVNPSSLPVAAQISANISGAAGVDLLKTLGGTLLLSGNNTYAGQTYDSAGGLDIGSSTALGSGTLFVTGGTLLADSGPQTIANAVYLAGTTTIAGGNALTFSGPADLESSPGTVNGSPAPGTTTIAISNPVYAYFTGGLGDSDGSQSLVESGNGFLVLSGTNTYSGTTTINGGTLILKDGGTDINSTSFTVNSGATLRLDNSGALNLTDRIGDGATVALNGGTLWFIGASGAASSETIGMLEIGAGAATVISQVGSAAGSSAALTASNLARLGGGTVQFVGAGQNLGNSASANQILFSSVPTLSGSGTNAILPYATVVSSSGQVDLATLSLDDVLAFSNYATNISAAASGSDVLVSGSNITQTLTSSTSLNAILIRGSNDTIASAAGVTLTLSSGALVTAGGSGDVFSISTLALGSADGIIDTSASLTLTSTITGTAAYGLTKAGSGTLTLGGSGTSTYSGVTEITQGLVNVANSGALGATIGGAVQQVSITNPVPISSVAGIETYAYFYLTFNGQATAAIYDGSTSATVASDLDALSTIGGVGGSVAVTETINTANQNVYVISFGGALAGLSVPLLMLGTSGVVDNGQQPTYSITSLLAGGSAAAGTIVSAGAALELSGGASVSGEQLTLSGAGIAGAGSLESFSGNNSWSGPVSLSGNSTIYVDPGDTLNLGGAISGGGNLTKTGTGTLEYSGVYLNSLVGTTNVDQGTLLLDKLPGVAALDGPLVIGDDTEPALVQTAAAQQLNSVSTTISSTGELELLPSVAGSVTQSVQAVAVGGAEGTFSLTFNSQTVSNIPFNATPATVQSDLASLSTIGSSNVSVTGTPGNYQVVFQGSLATTQSELSASTSGGATASVSILVVGGGVASEDTVGALTMNIGTTSSSQISVDNSAVSLAFSTSGSLTVNATQPGLSPNSPAPMIGGAGNLAIIAPTGGSTSKTFTVNQGPAADDLVISATIVNGSTTAGGFSKIGAGRLVLDPASGANTYTNGTTIIAGQIQIQQAQALGTGATTVDSLAALELAGGIAVAGELLYLNGTGYNNTGALLNYSGNNTWTGSVDLSTTSTIGVEAGTQLTLGGSIIGSGGLTKLLPGTLILSGSNANSYTGTTTVSEGTLELDKASGVIAIAGALTVGNDAGGPDSDLVQLEASGQISSAASVTIESTGQLDQNGFNQTLSTLTMEVGPTQSGLLTTETGTLTLNGNATFTSTGTLYTGSPAATISGNLALGSGLHTFTVNPGTALDDAEISAAITGTGTVTFAGAGNIGLSANNTGWSSPISLDGATVALGNSGALGSGTLTVNAATTLRGDGTAVSLANNISMNATYALTIAGTQNFSLAGTVTGFSGGSATLAFTSTGISSLGNVVTEASKFVFLNTNFASNVTLAGTVSGSGYFEKTGLGQLTIGPTGQMNLATDVYVYGGVLAVSNASSINSSAIIEVESGGALDISGNQTFTNTLYLYNNLTINSGANGFLTGALASTSGTNIWSGNVVLSGAAAANYIGVDSGTLTITGIISQSASGSGIATVGAGMLVLGGSSSNTYTGLTTVDQGTLQLNKSGSANAIASGGVAVGDGGGGQNADVLQFGPAGGTAEIASSASVTVANTGLLDMATYAASVTIASLTMYQAPVSGPAIETGTGVLTLGSNAVVGVSSSGATDGSSPAATISGNLSLGSETRFAVAATLVASTADNLVVLASIAGTAPVLTGDGTMALTGANRYTGTTIIQTGFTLTLSGNGTDPDSQMWIQTGGTLLIDNQSAGALNNRLGSSVSLTIEGGTFDYLGAPGVASTESIGAVSIDGSDSIFESTVSTSPGSSVTITAASLSESAATGIYRFAGIGANLGSASNQLLFTSAPAMTGGIIPDAVLEDASGVDFATYGASGIAPASYVTSLASAGPTSNVILTSNQTLSASETVNAILFASPNVSVSVGSSTLSVGSGAVASEGAGDAISGGTLALGAEGIFDVESGDNLAISSSISGSGGLLKTGNGTLTLTGSNNYTGETWINAGIVNVQSGSALGPSSNTTNVLSGAGLQVQGNTSVAGSLVLAGTGPGSNGQGALQNVSGTNTWVGPINADNDIGVASGQLTLDGQITGTLVQVGTGILQVASPSANSQLNMTVDSGTLELNDPAGSAIASLVVGDGVGTAQAVMMQPSQFSSNSFLTIFNSGTVNLAGYSQSLTSIGIDDGSLTNSGSGGTLSISSLSFVGGTLNTGSGTLALTGTVPGISANYADQAVISGNLSLSGAASFTVSEGPEVDNLVINAAITGSGSMTMSGGGTMLLESSNNYSGGTTLYAGTLALGNAGGLGSGSLTIDGGTLRGDGGNISISNRVTVGGSFTLGGERDVGGTNTGITLAGNVTLDASPTITINDPLVSVAITGNISGAYAITKAGDGTLVLAGNNSYSGGTTITAGINNIQSSTALGTGSISVASGAALQLQGNLAIGNLPLTLNGTGFVGEMYGSGDNAGALENVSGTSTWGTGATPFTLSSNSYLGADSGEITLDGAMSGAYSVNVVGSGTVQFAGTAANTYSGTTIVNSGTLQLDKTTATAVAGALIIGDNQTTAAVQELAAAQLAAGISVTVSSTGSWNLSQVPASDGAAETLSNSVSLTLIVGQSQSGSVTTGNNILAFAGTGGSSNIVVSGRSGITSAVPATISGNLDLDNGTQAGTQTFTVNDTPAYDDLVVSANLLNGLYTSALTKAGAGLGRLVLSGNNAYSGLTTVSTGELSVQSSTGFGTAASGTTVSTGAALELQGGVNLASEAITLNGTGVFGDSSTNVGAASIGGGALRSTGGNNVVGGNIVFDTTTSGATTAIGVDSGQLTLSGAITSTYVGPLAKVGLGTLVLSGSSSNTYQGNTLLNQGTTLVEKASGYEAFGGVGFVMVGDNLGGPNSAILQVGTATTTNLAYEVVVQSDGELDLATYGVAARVADLTTTAGPSSSANIETGNTTLTIAGNLTHVVEAGTTAASPAATIAGNVMLDGYSSITVNRGAGGDDLDISAPLDAAFPAFKYGWGTMALSGKTSLAFVLVLEPNSGTVVVANSGFIADEGVVINSGSTLAFRGSIDDILATPMFVSGNGVVSATAGARSGAIDNLGGNNTVNGAISLSGAAALGATIGTLNLTGNITGSYALTVGGFGTLLTDGNSLAMTSVSGTSVTYGGDATLSGSVTITGSGGLSPGGSAPAVFNTRSVTLNSSAALDITLDGPTAGTGYDQENASGTVNLAGATLALNVGYVPAAGQQFTIITSTSPVTGTFNGLANGSVFSTGGISFQIFYNDGGDNVVLIADSAPSLSGSTSLPTIINASSIANGGMSVSALIAGGLSITDPNGGALQGIAVDGANNTNGNWQFSTNGGASWTSFGNASDTAARLLAANSSTLVRFVPNAGYGGMVAGGLTFRAWDQTSGTNGGTADASINGAGTPFSSATAFASVDVDAPPTIVGAYVSGANWSSTYLGVLAADGVGSSTLGFELASGGSQLTTSIPWTNANEISIAFSEPVNVSQSSLTLDNGSNTAASVSSFSYNSSTNVATWQFNSSLATGEYLINLAGVSITDADGTELDGAWTTSVSTFSAGSGNGTPGSDFNFYFNVLPGDATGDGQVNGTDLLFMKLNAGAPVASNNYRYDLQGAATISSSAILTEKLNAGLNTSMFSTPDEPAQSVAQVAEVTTTATADPTQVSMTGDSGSSATSAVAASSTPISAPASSVAGNPASMASTASDADSSDASSAAVPASSTTAAAAAPPAAPAAFVTLPGTAPTTPAETLASESAAGMVSVNVPLAPAADTAIAGLASGVVGSSFAELENNVAFAGPSALGTSAPSISIAAVSRSSAMPSSTQGTAANETGLSAAFELFGSQFESPMALDAAAAISADSAWSPSDRTSGQASSALSSTPISVRDATKPAIRREQNDEESGTQIASALDLAFDAW